MLRAPAERVRRQAVGSWPLPVARALHFPTVHPHIAAFSSAIILDSTSMKRFLSLEVFEPVALSGTAHS